MPLVLSRCPGSLCAIKSMAICVGKAIAATRLMAFFGDNFPLKWLSRSHTSFLGGA
ncbi:hypothetical protein B0H10DRAFT_2007048 [Mycena sp. CBHHK59/15]|nr:hypothetical protein B0H10DRAFT_2007048 [Mycena sp. CBHHK59/15]